MTLSSTDVTFIVDGFVVNIEKKIVLIKAEYSILRHCLYID